MRLLFLLPSLSSGGAERVTATLANHWAEKGWSITIVTVSSIEQDFYALDPRIHRIAIRMDSPSRNAGQAVANNLRRIWAVRRILRQELPDVAVAMMPTANVVLALAGQGLSAALIGSERIYPPAVPLGPFWEWLRRRAYPLLSGVVAQTEDSAVWLTEHAAAKHIAVIPNPVNYPLALNAPRILPAEVVAYVRGEKLLLAIGRLEKQKGFDRLLMAFASVSPRHPEWSLVILGRGSLLEALKQQACNLGISDRVALPGAMGNVGEWLEYAALYVLTSRFEGFPNALLEALAHGVPSVAMDCTTGPKEILRHETDGLLVPQDDLHALAAALDRMMSDPTLRARFSRRAVEVRERFAVQKIAELWERFFEETMNEGKS